MILLPLGKRIYDQHLIYSWDDKDIADTLSEEPFGAYYFDQYLDTLYGKRLMHGTSEKLKKYPCNYIILRGIENWKENYNSDRIEKYIKLANSGSNFLITGDNYYLSLNLGCVTSNSSYYDFDIDRLKKSKDERRVKKIPFALKTNIDPNLSEYPTIYLWENMIYPIYLYIPEDAEENADYVDCYHGIDKGSASSIISLRQGGDIALRRNIGKGHITLVNTPYLLTNYGLSFEDGRKGVNHILDCAINPKLPVVVIYEKEDMKKMEVESDNKKSMFYVLLERPATALALYLLLGAFLLTLIFNARRRQRAETIVEIPQNSSITYIKHLATLYKASSDYKELLQIERRNLLYRLRKEYRFDIRTQEFTKPSEFASRIAESNSLDENKIKGILLGIDRLCDGEGKVDADSYKYIIESLQILNNKTTK